MGLYTYIREREQYKNASDEKVNKMFQEALEYDPSLMISETKLYRRKYFFSKEKKVTLFTIYHEEYGVTGSYTGQAQKIWSSYKRGEIIAYLKGIINGVISEKRNVTYNKK